jgi:hypothetical protein
MTPPNCHTCRHHRSLLPESMHSRCVHPWPEHLRVEGDAYGRACGWFNWPQDFDPTWLLECNGWEAMEERRAV